MDSTIIETKSARHMFIIRLLNAIEKRFVRFADSDSLVIETNANMGKEAQIQELRDAIKDACKEEIQTGLDKTIPKLLDGVSTAIKQEIENLYQVTLQTSPEKDPRDRELEQEVDMLRVKNSTLEEENRRLQQELSQIQQVADQRIKDAELKSKEAAKRLHKIIIDSGLDDSGPTDDEIEKAFSQLSHTIFQFVIKHCTNHRSRDGVYGQLPPEAKNSYVVGSICNQIYNHLFAPGVKIFGLGRQDNEYLGYIEQGLLECGRVPYSEIVEWRVCTSRLGQRFDPAGDLIADECKRMAGALYTKLGPFWHYLPKELHKRGIEIKPALEDIFQQAYRIAILFRRSKVEYRWLQKDSEHFRALNVEDMEEIASAGYKSLAEAVQADNGFAIVFGAVVKGTRPLGSIAEGSHLLRKCAVLLGPIPVPPPRGRE